MARGDLPTGAVTFLFTDVEGSTRLLHELGTEGYAAALETHRAALRDVFAAADGVEVDTQGDAFFFAFASAPAAVAAATRGCEVLEAGPIRVRIGVHTGTPHVGSEGYVGEDVHLAARIAAAGHGNQVLVSAATRALVDDDLVALGEHRLKDFADAVALFQVGSREFPPLKTVSNTNLPRPASSFVGREREVEDVASLLSNGTRLLTLTGPGGSGKTRLGIEAAVGLVPQFGAGVFWVGLSPLRDPALVTTTIAQTLGAKDGLAGHIGERELLLLLDNMEQVVAAAPDLAELVERCPNLRLLVTSRELLRVRGEHEYPVEPLGEVDAVELYCARAGTDPDEDVRELCRALDSLPLALELAAARAKVLSPRQIRERLSERLDLLEGGRDADPRQQTLRATIEWSHDLLDGEEKALFARLSVFAGSCTLDAATEVANAEVRVLQSLVEKSLLRVADERFWLLETLRAFAAERLEERGEGEERRGRHAEHFRDLAVRQDDELRAGVPEEGPVAILERDIHNLRAAVDHGLETGDAELVRAITVALTMYWSLRGLYAEGRAWLERALELTDVEDDTRRRLLRALATVAYVQGDLVAAKAASDRAASLAAELGGATRRLDLLAEQGWAAMSDGDLEAADRLFSERFTLAVEVDNGVAISSCRLNRAAIANLAGHYDAADKLLAENLPFTRSRGQVTCETWTLASQAEVLARYRGRPEEVGDDASRASELALGLNDTPALVYCLDLFAYSAAARGDVERAALILAATEAARESMGAAFDEDELAIRTPALDVVGVDVVSGDTWANGRALALEDAVELARSSQPDQASLAGPA
jgi:predicted ATPase